MFDKFHLLSHLCDALDDVRKTEYVRLSSKDRGYIMGQKHTLLSSRENPTLNGRHALKQLLAANKRINTACVLKESFGQRRSYKCEGWARCFRLNFIARTPCYRSGPGFISIPAPIFY